MQLNQFLTYSLSTQALYLQTEHLSGACSEWYAYESLCWMLDIKNLFEQRLYEVVINKNAGVNAQKRVGKIKA